VREAKIEVTHEGQGAGIFVIPERRVRSNEDTLQEDGCRHGASKPALNVAGSDEGRS